MKLSDAIAQYTASGKAVPAEILNATKGLSDQEKQLYSVGKAWDDLSNKAYGFKGTI